MRLRYHELVGKQVVTADGQPIGAIVDLVAEQQGDDLRVTAFQVGLTALARRISFRRAGTVSLQANRIPWRLVAGIDAQVHLSVDRASVDRLPQAPSVEAGPSGTPR
ncbi:MAG TPA: PRC-barrel domain-containing protein [Chloroflexota bacterium]|nr:PRC-barrel domain-containing protein [Chloroflexota bacterium]